MKNVVDQLDRLKNALDAEAALRQATSLEWARGVQNGPMRVAHDAQILECIAAAKALVDFSGTG